MIRRLPRTARCALCHVWYTPKPSSAAEQVPTFPQVCVVIRISKRPNPRYHCPFLYDDEHGTIGRLPAVAGDSGSRGTFTPRLQPPALQLSNRQFRD
jgi:hypothetical protein